MSSLKKNTLAIALVAGLGLTGAAAAYNYGTLQDPANCGYNDCTQPTGSPGSEGTATPDLLAAEPVAWQMISVTGPNAFRYTMREQLVWDINPQDNAVNFTQGFTARLQLKDGATFDTSYTPTVFNITDPATQCSLWDHDSNPATPNILFPTGATTGNGARTTEDIYLDGSLQCTWDVSFDNYYNSGDTISIRITPKQGVTNPQNPSNGMTLRYDNARLASLEEFMAGPLGTKVTGDYWLINPINDSPFQGSLQNRDILVKVDAAAICTNIDGADTDKFIDVADSWFEDQKPKTRFSLDGRLGTALDDTIVGDAPGFTSEDSQWIDLGDITFNTNDTAGGGFTFLAGDEFVTTLQGDTGGWAAFDNNSPVLFTDDLWLVDGDCLTGTQVARGDIRGTQVVFEYDVTDAGVPLNDPSATAALTVCGFVDTDVVINDQEIDVSTTLIRDGLQNGQVVFGGNRQCMLLPLRYNGSTMEVFMLNPGNNAAQETFLRLTNRSKTAGYVRLEGIDDAGNEAPNGQVSIWLEAGASTQVRSIVLEDGGAGVEGSWGKGTGKWRTIVTAEFPGLVAQSYVRSAVGQVLANITDSDTRGEQFQRDQQEGTWASEIGERPSDYNQEFSPDFRGNGRSDTIPGGPNGGQYPAGGTTDECDNPGVSPGSGANVKPNC